MLFGTPLRTEAEPSLFCQDQLTRVYAFVRVRLYVRTAYGVVEVWIDILSYGVLE
jgi:hypothetical protein